MLSRTGPEPPASPPPVSLDTVPSFWLPPIHLLRFHVFRPLPFLDPTFFTYRLVRTTPLATHASVTPRPCIRISSPPSLVSLSPKTTPCVSTLASTLIGAIVAQGKATASYTPATSLHVGIPVLKMATLSVPRVTRLVCP